MIAHVMEKQPHRVVRKCTYTRSFFENVNRPQSPFSHTVMLYETMDGGVERAS